MSMVQERLQAQSQALEEAQASFVEVEELKEKVGRRPWGAGVLSSYCTCEGACAFGEHARVCGDPVHPPTGPLGPQEEEREQQLHEAQRVAAEAAAEAAQLQQALDARAEEVAALQAEAAQQAQQLAALDAELEAARAAAEAGSAAVADAEVVARQLAKQVAALEEDLKEARSEAAAKASSCEQMDARVTDLMQELAATRAASKAKSAAVAGGKGFAVAQICIGGYCQVGLQAEQRRRCIQLRAACALPSCLASLQSSSPQCLSWSKSWLSAHSKPLASKKRQLSGRLRLAALQPSWVVQRRRWRQPSSRCVGARASL